MTADVVKATQNSVFPAGDQKRLSDEIESEVVTRKRRLVHVADELPTGSEELGFLFFKCPRVKIETRGQSGGASDVAIGLRLQVRHGLSGAGHSIAEGIRPCCESPPERFMSSTVVTSVQVQHPTLF